MRDNIPMNEPCNIECGIINLDSMFSTGTHWTCYMKKNNNVLYFDSYGNANPPLELQKYLLNNKIFISTDEIQNDYDPPICGHLCLYALKLFSEGCNLKIISQKIFNNKYGFLSFIDI